MALLKVYRDSGFIGGHVDVTSDITNLKDKNFNDLVSSAVVESGTFTLFEHKDFKGWSVTVSAIGGINSDGRYDSYRSLGGRNDRVSSIKVNSDLPS